MKKYIFWLILCFIPISFISANDISKIDMKIYVDNAGTAHVTESWSVYVTNGTEGYHPYFNVGNSDIVLESVYIDNNFQQSVNGFQSLNQGVASESTATNNFQIVNNWDVNASFDEKANKAGIYRNGDEIDLCFGLTKYGNNKYVIKYTITNFVSQLKDADMVYWTLFPKEFSASPQSVNIYIYSDNKFDNQLPVWGFGKKGGTAYVADGIIEMHSENSVNSNEYMTILVKFPKNTFATNNYIDSDFEHYLKQAKKGSQKYVDIGGILSFLSPFFFIGIIIIIGLLVNKANQPYKFRSLGRKINKEVPNFRDIPCNKDIYRAYFIATVYGLNSRKEDFLGSVLLKWVKQGNVILKKVEVKKTFSNKIEPNIIFVKKPESIDLEIKMYDWMYEASQDGQLESKEFSKWCSKNYEKILKWFDDVMEYERDILIGEGKVTQEKDKYYIEDSLKPEAEQLYGSKKFLKEFSNIKDREPIEIMLWNEYLMFAQILGIAKKVAEQFKKLYPEINDMLNNNGLDIDDIIFINYISHTSMNNAISSRDKARSYSSGGGGFMSGGGGGGSFGGGGGGGGFR